MVDAVNVEAGIKRRQPWVYRRPYRVSVGCRCESSRSLPCRRDANSNEYGAEAGAFEDTLVLFNLQAGAVGRATDAEECRSCDGEPDAEKRLVTVF